MEHMLDLRCPKCKKKLAEIERDYFNTQEDKNTDPNKGKLLLKCPKCKEVLELW